MKKGLVLLAIVLLAGLSVSLSADAYDKNVVVESMRGNVARIGAIKAAIAAQDYYAAGKGFFDYGTEAATMLKMDPPKGSKEEWVKLWKAFQDKAFMGVGACGERDAEKSLKLLDEILAFNQVGHATFR